MINALRRTPALWTLMSIILFAAATPAHSQAPTDAQRSAIRSQCRADYEAHCASIPPGGKASLQCLQQNMSSLSSSCQSSGARRRSAGSAQSGNSTDCPESGVCTSNTSGIRPGRRNSQA